MRSLKSVIAALKQALIITLRVDVTLDEIKINQGIILAELKEKTGSKQLSNYEYKIFSQWGEDGIIQHLINIVAIENKTFIEFGIEDFVESNCRYLLMKDNWSGFVIDGSAKNIKKLKQSYFYWKHDLVAIDAFITKDNINDLLSKSGFEDDLGILSIDLDGNDYYILEAITFYRPRILICEYNAVFGATRKISVPYEPTFNRTKKHSSNLYSGASLAAMMHLAQEKGYSLVGTNTAGGNAFFVRDDLLNDRLEIYKAAQEVFSPSKFRESQDEEGNLTYIAGDDRLELIRGLPVFNVEASTMEIL